MRIAFYAPLKAPTSRSPSGDRSIARLFVAALRRKEHDVVLASSIRTLESAGDLTTQRALRAEGERAAEKLVSNYERSGPPDLWFTYHLFHKAPDWLGPRVADRFGIPYVLAEASYAPKQTGGPWSEGHAAVRAAIARADHVFFLNPDDRECVLPIMGPGAGHSLLPPFVETAQPGRAPRRSTARQRLSARFGLPEDACWLLAVAMMRRGDKALSYRVLADALARIADRPWRLIVAGDGEAAAGVRAAFDPVAPRVSWAGALDARALRALYTACDMFVWPAVNEAIGMALLEAHAAGLPAVAGRAGAVPSIVRHEETGLLTGPTDAAAIAAAIARLVDDADQRRAYGAAARAAIESHHGLDAAAGVIDATLRQLVRRSP